MFVALGALFGAFWALFGALGGSWGALDRPTKASTFVLGLSWAWFACFLLPKIALGRFWGRIWLVLGAPEGLLRVILAPVKPISTIKTALPSFDILFYLALVLVVVLFLRLLVLLVVLVLLLLVRCLLYTSPSPRDRSLSRMPSSA